MEDIKTTMPTYRIKPHTRDDDAPLLPDTVDVGTDGRVRVTYTHVVTDYPDLATFLADHALDHDHLVEVAPPDTDAPPSPGTGGPGRYRKSRGVARVDALLVVVTVALAIIVAMGVVGCGGVVADGAAAPAPRTVGEAFCEAYVRCGPYPAGFSGVADKWTASAALEIGVPAGGDYDACMAKAMALDAAIPEARVPAATAALDEAADPCAPTLEGGAL